MNGDKDKRPTLVRSDRSYSRSLVKSFSDRNSNRSKKSLSFRSKVSKILVQRQWSKFLKIIKNKTDELNSSFHEESILHEVCKYQPTPEVVEKILSLFPDLASLKNDEKQFPLHIAAQYGASSDVISFLCKSNSMAPGSKDMNGRTPLHLTCLFYSKHYNDTDIRSIRSAIALTIKLLVQCSPMTVNRRDNYGKTALQYAHDSAIDPKSFQFLHKASETEQKIRESDCYHSEMKTDSKDILGDMLICSRKDVLSMFPREKSDIKTTKNSFSARCA